MSNVAATLGDKPFRILSPDEFDINREGGFDTWQEAFKFYDEWKKGFEQQGYYSSTIHGRIHLSDLQDFCQWVGFDNVPTYEYLSDEEKHFIDSLSFTQE
jgi:hypothetical protein